MISPFLLVAAASFVAGLILGAEIVHRAWIRDTDRLIKDMQKDPP